MHGNARDDTIGTNLGAKSFLPQLAQPITFGKLHLLLRIIHRAENCRLAQNSSIPKAFSSSILNEKFTSSNAKAKTPIRMSLYFP